MGNIPNPASSTPPPPPPPGSWLASLTNYCLKNASAPEVLNLAGHFSPPCPSSASSSSGHCALQYDNSAPLPANGHPSAAAIDNNPRTPPPVNGMHVQVEGMQREATSDRLEGMITLRNMLQGHVTFKELEINMLREWVNSINAELDNKKRKLDDVDEPNSEIPSKKPKMEPSTPNANLQPNNQETTTDTRSRGSQLSGPGKSGKPYKPRRSGRGKTYVVDPFFQK